MHGNQFCCVWGGGLSGFGDFDLFQFWPNFPILSLSLPHSLLSLSLTVSRQLTYGRVHQAKATTTSSTAIPSSRRSQNQRDWSSGTGTCLTGERTKASYVNFEGDFWPNVIEETIKELDQERKASEALSVDVRERERERERERKERRYTCTCR